MEKFAVFIDIDRTLTGKDFIIPEGNLRAIDEARSQGHKIFINTGRSRGNIPLKVLEQVELDGIVAGSGTYIEVDGEVLRSVVLPDEKVIELASYFLGRDDCWSILEGVKHSYLIRDAFSTRKDGIPLVESIEDVKKILGNDRIDVLAAGEHLPEEFIEKYGKEFSIYCFSHYADVFTKGFNKANGMAFVIEHLGIKKKNTMAIGDSVNDLEMLDFAGIGVAVGNADDNVKEAADYVVASNSEGGVGEAINIILHGGNNG